MAESDDEVVEEFLPFVRVYKDGRVGRLVGNDVVPPSVDPTGGVRSKDVVILPETCLRARLYLPKDASPTHKLPLLVYFHGGAFVVESAFSPTYKIYLDSLVADANVAVVSVNYRRAPEDPLPAAYDDSWAAIMWAVGEESDPWLKEYVNFERVLFGGDSAGANIAHHMAIRVGPENPGGYKFKLVGVFLSNPYFWGKDPVGNEIRDADARAFTDNFWRFACPSTTGSDDPLINPAMDPKLSTVACSRALVFVAEKDFLRERGYYYYELLSNCGWDGKVEIDETKGEGHVFFLFNPFGENAIAMLQKITAFLNED